MLKRLLALVLAGGLASACSDAKSSISSIWNKTRSTVGEAADSFTKSDANEDEDDEAKAAAEYLAMPKNAAECVTRGAAHPTLDSTNIRVTGTITDAKGAVALVNDGQHVDESVHEGDYIGTHCWRVREIKHDYLLLEQPYKDAAGGEQARTLQVDFSVQPTAFLRQPRR
jgi:Tfp pilus assembly protein PilP